MMRYVLAVTALIMGLTALIHPGWWASPAFNGLTGVIPLGVMGFCWLLASGGLVSGSRDARILGAAFFAGSAIIGSASIVVFTVQENLVAAMGSAIAWAFMAVVSLMHLREL